MSTQDAFILRLSSGRVLQLQEGVKLTAEDLLGMATTTTDGAWATVGRNPSDPTILGLQNLTSQVWSATGSSSGQRRVEPGRSLKLAGGTTINFGPITGTIRELSGGFSLGVSSGLTIPLPIGVRLTASDFLGMGGASARGPAAEVGRNPNDSTILGLKNLSGQVWSVSVPGGGQRRIDPGKSVRLTVGTMIDFGAATGEIQQGAPVSVPARSFGDAIGKLLGKVRQQFRARQIAGLGLAVLAGLAVASVLPLIGGGLSPLMMTALIFLVSFVVALIFSFRRPTAPP
jgi:hypothetical protein